MADSIYVRQWFRKGDFEYSSAEFLFRHRPLPVDVICYLCQQAVEKWLKGFMIHNGIGEPPHTHELGWLCKMCTDG
ncbi:MAG: HEPN domain-containing protein [Peptococcaceae bacterium]|jgi:HEPN domain-containing protein|nr:HEPN domain-containing protein [Peptococcaceae bacterium]